MRLLYRYFGYRPAVAVLCAALGASLAAGYYAIAQLEVNTETEQLLSDELPPRRTMARYKRLFPQNQPELLLVVEALTPERAQAVADGLVERVRGRGQIFAHAHRPDGGPFFRRHALLYQEMGELQRLSDRVARMQPLLAMVRSDPSLRGLLGALERIVTEERGPSESERLSGLLEQMEQVVRAQLDRTPAVLSWQRLMRGAGDQSGVARALVVVQAAGEREAESAVPKGVAVAALRGLIAESGLGDEGWPRVRITGSAALAQEEMGTLLEGMAVGGPIALLLVMGVLLVGLRSVRLVAVTVITLLVGLMLTAGFAAATVGRLNLISMAFALLYLGLGVDFAIHFLMRYRAMRRRGESPEQAHRQTQRQMAGTLTLCALTTAIGFLAFVPTAFVGVAELGIIAGGGMLVSLAATLTVLPALLAIWPAKARGRDGLTMIPRPLRWLIERPARHRGLVLVLGAAVTVASAAALPRARFNTDPLDLRPAESEAVRTLEDLRASASLAGGEGALVLRSSGAEARRRAAELQALPEVARAVTVFDLIPDNQAAKLAVIENLVLLAGPDWGLDPQRLSIEPVEAQIEAVRSFRDALAGRQGQRGDREVGAAAAADDRLREALTAWLDASVNGGPAEQRAWVAELHERLMSTLPIALNHFRQALEAESVNLSKMPSEVRSRWVASDGTFRVQVTPAAALTTDAARRRFVEAVRSVAPDAGGSTVLQVEAGRAIVRAFSDALIYAALGIVVLLLVLMRSVRLTLAVLLPLAAGGIMTVAAMVGLGMPFNFANVIALPLLLGVGVDNGIHMVQRGRRGVSGPAGLLETTTARGVLFSTLTTLCGFGGLALSPHPGTASMGLLLCVGLLLNVGCTLVLLPALFHPDRASEPAAAEEVG